jgi:ABC-2 type transport system permease protein
MNAQFVSEARIGSAATASQPISAWGRFYWSVQRELWENRAVYVAPLAVAGLMVFGVLISAGHMVRNVRAALQLDPMQRIDAIARPYNVAAAAIMGTTLLVGIFYCLGAMHSERRDRSILFWKSLPVSDLTTVLAKASIPIVAIPAITFGITVAMQAVMLAIETAAVAARGANPQELWSNLPIVQMWLMLLYHLVTVHAIWYAPIFGWLLLVSAWARRAPFLWASVPLLAVGIVEKIAFNTSYFGALLLNRIGGGPESSSFTSSAIAMDGMTTITPWAYLINPGLWIGLAFTAACLAGAARLRRLRGPI